MPDYDYSETRRISYGDEGASFIPVCENCHRYVKADDEIYTNEIYGLSKRTNATCSKCGRTKMLFEGFIS